MNTISIALSICLLTTALGSSVQAAQQEQPVHDHAAMAVPDVGWTWATDANVIAGYNYQSRLFADFPAVESQNWFRLAGIRASGPGRLTLSSMLSLEPLTIGRLV